MSRYKRRDFLKLSALSAMPFIGSGVIPATSIASDDKNILKDSDAVYFINDGIFYKPENYINKLQEINASTPVGVALSITMQHVKLVTVPVKNYSTRFEDIIKPICLYRTQINR